MHSFAHSRPRARASTGVASPRGDREVGGDGCRRSRASSRAMEANAGEEAEARVEDSSTRAGETTAVETGKRAECGSASEGKGGGEASASASDDAARAKRARVNGRVEVKMESAEAEREGGGGAPSRWVPGAASRGETILTKAQVAKLASKLPYGFEFMGVDGPIGHVSREGELYGRSAEEERRWAASQVTSMGAVEDDFVPDFVGLDAPKGGRGHKSGQARAKARGGRGGRAGGKAKAKAARGDALAADPFAAAFVDVVPPMRPVSGSGAALTMTGMSSGRPHLGTAKQPSARALAEEREKKIALRKRLIELENLVTTLSVRAMDLIEGRDALSLISQRANADVNAIDTKRKASSVSRGVSSVRQKLACKPDTQIGFDTLRYRCLLEVVHKQCLTSVRQLIAHKWGFPFASPVDPDALGLPTYREIVTEPMDLGTIKKLIEDGGKYVMSEEVDADVRLTFANAMKFNGEGTDVHVMARELLAEWEPKWDAIKQRIVDVEACCVVEREMAEAKNEAARRRADLVNKEKECANAIEALGVVSAQLRQVETQVFALMRPLSHEDRLTLASNLRSLPDELRKDAENIVATNGNGYNKRAHLEDINAHNDITLHLLSRYAKTVHRNRIAVVAGWCGHATPEHVLAPFKREPEVPVNVGIADFVIGQPIDDMASGLGIQSIDNIPDEMEFDPGDFHDLLEGVPLDVSADGIDMDLGL